MAPFLPDTSSFDLLDVAHHGVLVTDADDQVLWTNALVRTWLGDLDPVGRSSLELFVEDERGRVAQRTGLRQFGVAEEYSTQLSGFGAGIPVRVSVTPRFDDEGTFLGTTAILRDERDPADPESVIDAGRLGQQVLNRFLTPGVAHALNTTLQAVLGYAGLLARAQPRPDPDSAAARLHAAALACAKLVENLSALGDPASEATRAVSMTTLLDEALESREIYLPANNVALRRDYPDEPVYAEADPARLRRAIAHLVGNASELALTQGGGSVELIVRCTDDKVGVTVAVVGRGYPEALVTFLPADVRPGLDPMVLGHAAAWGLIAESGGDVIAENTERGGEVHFTLPRAAAPATAEPPADPAAGLIDRAPSTSALDARILVVDDEEFILDLNRRALGGMVDVVTAGSADEAYELLQEGSFDLIVSDLRMPGALDGMGLYHWAARSRPEQAGRMVFTTADTASGPALDFLVRSRRPFITKPYDVADYRAFMLRELSRQVPDDEDPED